VTVSLRGFRPTTDYATTCWTDSPTAHAFFTFTARTDGAGNYDAPRSLCWFGQPGRQVWLTVGGVTSNVLTW
jgi:hypothetical protein